MQQVVLEEVLQKLPLILAYDAKRTVMLIVKEISS